MGVYIKGMEMPKSCTECWFRKTAWHEYLSDCQICPFTGETTPYTKRKDNCPLVPVPPRGRLIDADELAQQYVMAQEQREKDKTDYSNAFMSNGEPCTEWWCVEDMLENAPTIIPAEGGE